MRMRARCRVSLFHGVRKKDGGRTVGLLLAYFWLGRVGFARRRWRRTVRDRAFVYICV